MLFPRSNDMRAILETTQEEMKLTTLGKTPIRTLSDTFGHFRTGAAERLGCGLGQASDSFLAKIPRVPEDSYGRVKSEIANRLPAGITI